jgi:glycosyltransferase involved in cell wall biosynthesis
VVVSKSQLTVLSLISSEGYFGAENMLLTLAGSLSDLGCSYIVGVLCDSRFNHVELAEEARRQHLTVEVVRCAGRCDWRAVSRIRALKDKHQANLVHTHGYKADFYARIATWGEDTPLVATCHNWPSKAWIMRAYAVLDRLVLRGFDGIVVISDTIGDLLRRSGVRANKLRKIPNGIDTRRFRAAEPILGREIASSGDALVGFVGRCVPDKGGAILLQAAEQVLRRFPLTKFVFVGDGPARSEWESLAERLGIRDRVVFTGVRNDMPEVYASLTLFVLPSLCEAMPMSVLEAMAAGRPVVATRVGSVTRLVVQGETGLLVEAGDVDGLASAIVKLLRDPGQAARMGLNARVRAESRFSARVMARGYFNLYRDVLQKSERLRQYAVV